MSNAKHTWILEVHRTQGEPICHPIHNGQKAHASFRNVATGPNYGAWNNPLTLVVLIRDDGKRMEKVPANSGVKHAR
jgi:hypothetical protein